MRELEDLKQKIAIAAEGKIEKTEIKRALVIKPFIHSEHELTTRIHCLRWLKA